MGSADVGGDPGGSEFTVDTLRVLFVDDDPEYAAAAAEFFGSVDDVSAVVETCAHDGLARLADEAIDVVVSDYEMPETDGLEFLERLREDHPDLPFVLLTGQGSEAVASAAISAGVTDCVRKGSGTAQFRALGDQLRRAAVGYRARRRLRVQEARFRKLIEGSTDLVSVLDDAGTVEYVSPAVTSILGYEPSDLVGMDAFEGVHPEDRKSVEEQFRAAVADQSRTPSAEFRCRAADGEWRVLEATGRNMLDDPDVGGFVVNASDVTERRARQRELRRQNERLEEFASVVSHGMRNPLAVAGGRLQLTRDDCESEHLDAMAAAHDRMGRLIDDLLTFAQQGQLVEETAPVGLEEVVSEALASIDADAEPAVSVEPVTVVADRERLL